MPPKLERWDVTLKCRGYFGFGGGYATVKGYIYKDNAMYCNVCPISTACWNTHKKRVQKMLPELTAHFEEMAARLKGKELMDAWWKENEMADPYIMVNGGNIEDGMSVANVGRVKDRGPFGLTWPLEELPPDIK